MPSPDWKQLFRIACSLIEQANADQTVIDSWTFGGGTAMMIQIDHRESHDVDIFLPDPQLLSFLDPQKQDFEFEIVPSDYRGDGARFLKLSFAGIGEIDFIVAAALTNNPTVQQIVEGRVTQVETVSEIIAKKVHYRGASIRPRDIFDIAAAGQAHAGDVIAALGSHKAATAVVLAKISELNPEFVRKAISELAIKDAYKQMRVTALERAVDLLRSV
jgi:hypothetical protein